MHAFQSFLIIRHRVSVRGSLCLQQVACNIKRRASVCSATPRLAEYVEEGGAEGARAGTTDEEGASTSIGLGHHRVAAALQLEFMR
jgi:hypothetical protein